MQYEDFRHIKFDKRGDGVLTVTLDRPQVMNATNARMHWELTQIWQVVREDSSVKVVVVTGAGDRAFSAGGDLDWVQSLIGNAEAVVDAMDEAKALVYNMLDFPKPIISAINGTAVGAGLAVAILADISVIAEDAKITDGHVKLGVAAGDHAPIIWPLLCGMSKSKYYLMTGEFMTGREAERLGLVTFSLPQAEVLPRALEIAGKLAVGSQEAIRHTKMSLNNWMRMAGPIFDNALTLEMMGFLGADAKEGLEAIRAKRKPDFPSAHRADVGEK